MTAPTRALCIARHTFLSEHLGLFFSGIGLTTRCVVGIPAAAATLTDDRPDVIICDYDLLASLPVSDLGPQAMFAQVPVLAVSMTRRPEEMQTLDISGIGGVLYLPLADAESTLGMLELMRRASQYSPTREWLRPSVAAPSG